MNIQEPAMSAPSHHSYLLRLWRERSEPSWRVTLIPVARPDERRHFADLEALCAFLRAQAGAEPDLNDDRNTTYCTPSETS
jgi:hypothetical protein